MKLELTPAVVGWALVFSIPPGVGATLAVYGLTGQPITSPDALTVGAGVAALLFALVVVVAGVVPEDEPDEESHWRESD